MGGGIFWVDGGGWRFFMGEWEVGKMSGGIFWVSGGVGKFFADE